jgi:hypothetical protein
MPAAVWYAIARRSRTASKNPAIALLKRQCRQPLEQIDRHIEALDAEIAALGAADAAFGRRHQILTSIAGVGTLTANQFIAANTIAYADIPNEKVAAASTLSAVTQQVGLALGVSFGGLMLGLTRGLGTNGASETALRPDAFALPFLAIGLVTLMAAPVYLALDPKAGANMSGHGQDSPGGKL